MPKVPVKQEDCQTFEEYVKKSGIKAQSRRKEPLWKGPYEDGLSQSLICRFLCCRERFRIRTVEGLEPNLGFHLPIHYGNMWHVCEEHHVMGQDWRGPLLAYAKELAKEFRNQQELVLKWYNICYRQFEVYIKVYSNPTTAIHKRKGYKHLSSEQVFEIKCPITHSRIVKLRGKFDSIFVDKDGVWLLENKTKSEIDEAKIVRQLKFDLQTMLYITAIKYLQSIGAPPFDGVNKKYKTSPIAGVLYNVVKRPLSGGKGTIRQHKPSKKNPTGESEEVFYNRLKGEIQNNTNEFFGRWNVRVSESDITTFQKSLLMPIVTSIADWWDALQSNLFDPWKSAAAQNGLHWRTPYGLYNVLLEGGYTDLDDFIDSGSLVGLRHSPCMFPELK